MGDERLHAEKAEAGAATVTMMMGLAVVGTPHPSRMQTTAVMTRVKKTVSPFRSVRPGRTQRAEGLRELRGKGRDDEGNLEADAGERDMPTMMPTVAAAAPTPIAYFAPTTKASTRASTAPFPGLAPEEHAAA